MFRNIIKSRLLHLILPALIIGIIISLSFKKDYVLFPGNRGADVTSYTDTIHPFDSGNTTINRFIVDSSAILVEYTIGKMNTARYAGFQWIVHPPKPFIDISNYDHVILSFDETTTEEFVVVILQIFTDGFSQLDDRMSWRYFSKELSIKDKQKQYCIPLAEFKTPLWWFNQYKINEMDLNKPDFSRLGMLSVQDGSDATGHHRVLVLKELRFRNLKALSLASCLIGSLILYYLCYGIGIVLYKKQKKNKEPMAIPYHELAIDNDTIDEKKKILEYLGSNFSDQNLSLSKMSDDIGVSTVKISSIIKQSYNLSFRQYLNTIRIAEAKRLLQKTKLQISQIAYKVGYTNLTHFCRTFKEVSSVSPNAFRQGVSGEEETKVPLENNPS